MKPSKRIQNISSYYFADLDRTIANLKAEGKSIIRLDIGSPDLPPHPAIIEKLHQSALLADHHGYQPHRGTAKYRRAWGEMYKRVFDVEIDPDSEIIPLMGSKEGIFHLLQVMLDPDDVVLIPNPYYPTYIKGTQFTGASPYFLPATPENDYLPDFSTIPSDISQRAKMLWLNYPNNPTGATATLEFYQTAVAYCREHDILLCTDAAYTQLHFGTPQPSIFQIDRAKDTAVEFNSLSKSHNMAGWRMGALLGNQDILNNYLTIKTNSDSGQFLPMMEAAATALSLDQAWLTSRNQIYRQRRDLIVERFHSIGVNITPPEAALYIWAPIPEGWSSMAFSIKILEKSNVSITPGTVFGENGEGFIRISFVKDLDILDRAMESLCQSWANI